MGSKGSFVTLVAELFELLSNGGDFSMLRLLWGHFCASLGDRVPELSIKWNLSAALVSNVFSTAIDLVFGIAVVVCVPYSD